METTSHASNFFPPSIGQPQYTFRKTLLMRAEKTVTTKDVLSLIRLELTSIPPANVYYTLKRMQVKPLFQQTVETMRFCLAAHRLGLRITVPLISTLRERAESTVSQSLHTLGDKNCLTLLRGSRNSHLQWILSPIFLDLYSGGKPR